MIKNILQKLKPRLEPLPNDLSLKDFHVMLATWFGSGLIRPAPGTMGSLAALPIGYGIYNIFGLYLFFIAIIIVFALGVMSANYFDQKSDTHDNRSIVIDEVVGLWIAAIPAGNSLILWAAAFVFFRLFDIWKPWPISYIDKNISAGLGVMLDDVLAGVFAFLGTAMFALPFIGVLYV